MNADVPMCAGVIAFLPAVKQALFRSAGSLGVNSFEQLVEQQRIFACIKLSTVLNGDPTGLPSPLHVPVSSWTLSNEQNIVYEKNIVAVYNHRARRPVKMCKPDVMCPTVEYNFDDKHSDQYFPREFLHGVKGMDTITEDGIRVKITVKISGLTNCVELGQWLLVDCRNLVTVDFDSLDSLTIVGSRFLSGCSRLTSVDIAGNNQERKFGEIGHNFCFQCTSLERIKLSPSPKGNVMQHLTTIDGSFMSGCTNLESFEMSELVALTEIGYDFMYNCSKLKSISLTGIVKLGTIGQKFLYECYALESVTIDSLSSVTKVAPCFMRGCTSVKEIPALATLTNVQHIGFWFMAKCTSLDGTLIDLSRFTKLEEVEIDFMEDCPALDVINRANCPPLIEAQLPKVTAKSCCTIQ